MNIEEAKDRAKERRNIIEKGSPLVDLVKSTFDKIEEMDFVPGQRPSPGDCEMHESGCEAISFLYRKRNGSFHRLRLFRHAGDSEARIGNEISSVAADEASIGAFLVWLANQKRI